MLIMGKKTVLKNSYSRSFIVSWIKQNKTKQKNKNRRSLKKIKFHKDTVDI